MSVPTANEILSKFAQDTKEQTLPQQEQVPVVNSSPTPVEPKVEVKDTPVVETPATPVEPAPVDLDNWDDSQPSDPKPQEIDPFFKEVGIEAQSWDEVKTKLKERLVKEEYPDNLKKAIEVFKKGGDYLEVLKINSVDYSKIDPIQIYESHIHSNAVNPDEAKAYLDGKSEVEKRIEGKRLQQQYINYQKQQESDLMQKLEAEAARKAEAKKVADERLKSTLDKVEKIAGLTVKPHHKAEIFDAITTGRMQRELFFDQKTGEYDFNSMVETYFLKKNLPKIMDHLKKVTETTTKRTFLQEITNAEITKPSEKPKPETENRSQLERYVDSLKPKPRV